MERLARLLEALRVEGDDACERCLEHLDNYIEAQLAGEAYLSRFPEVAIHLDGCLECSAAYAILYEVEIAAAERLPQASTARQPDLSFLRDTPSLARALRDALTVAGERLLFRLSADLRALLAPTPDFVPVRSAGDERYSKLLFSFEREAADAAGFPFSFAAYQDELQPEQCLVEVTVQPPGRSWPDLAGIPVALTLNGMARREETDAWGVVSFEGVPVAALDDAVLEILLG